MARYFRYTKPKPINKVAMRNAVITMMNNAAKDAKELFERTESTWTHVAIFETETDYPDGLDGIFSVTVATDDDQYKLVSRGSPGHYISPVNVTQLKFPGTFRPKTTPGILKSGVGYSGPPAEYRGTMWHPGFEARRFDETVRDAFEPKFEKRKEKLMEVLRRVSGHAL